MAKIAVILPHKNLSVIVRSLVQVMNLEDTIILDYDGDHTTVPALVNQARRRGADIILSRGLIAAQVRACCDISVVEMRITAQELALLVQQAKVLTRKQPPTIAVVGFTNMFHDYSRLSELFHVNLTSYWVDPDSPDPYAGLEDQTIQAINDHVDVIIGGDTACSVARAHNIPSIFFTATQDSVQEGLRIARRVAYAIDLEKNNAFEIQTMLDTSFSILIRFNRDGYITTVNQAAVTRLEKKSFDICGRPLLSFLKGVSQQQLQQLLSSGKALHSAFITIGADQFIANLTPIRTGDGTIVGGVLSCDEVDRIEHASIDIRREQSRLRHPANHTFRDLNVQTEAMKQFCALAERFAQSSSPILIRCEPGCSPLTIAECIHNASSRQEMPFVSVNCAELTGEEQLRLIFGASDLQSDLPHSLCALAHMGTLYLQNPESLCPPAQSRLCRLLTQQTLISAQHTSAFPLDVRVITSTESSIEPQGTLSGFDPNLRLLLQGLPLRLPPMRHSPAAIRQALEDGIAHYCKTFERHLVLTAGGIAWLLEQNWPGNYLQIDRFCEHLVLSAPHRSVDERFLAALYAQTVPAISLPADPLPSEPLLPEAQQIQNALMRNGGNRTATARELGISTSTLWRKINKYKLNG